MQKRFMNEIIVITGSAKRIGEACAIAFAREGGKVAIADIDRDAGQKVVRKIKNDGGEAIFAKCDVSNSEDIHSNPYFYKHYRR